MAFIFNLLFLFDCYVCTLIFLLSKIIHVLLTGDTAVPIKYKHATYMVYEDEESVSITLQATVNHSFSFSVTVSTRDGTASCKCQAVVYGQTCRQSLV